MENLKSKIQIFNIVTAANFNHKLDLEAIRKVLPVATRRYKRFPGIRLRLEEPKVTIMIFASGQITCFGTKSIAQSRRAVEKMVKKLRDKSIAIPRIPEVHIRNLLALVKLSGSVDIDRAAYATDKAIYEPEVFPALMCWMDDPKAFFLVYGTGRIICAGVKSEADLYRAVDKFERGLKEAGAI